MKSLKNHSVARPSEKCGTTRACSSWPAIKVLLSVVPNTRCVAMKKSQRWSYTSITAIVLSLVCGSPRAIGQNEFNVPPDAAPASLSNGQELNLFPGGHLGDDFVVGENGTLNVDGGTVGHALRIESGAILTLSDGRVGRRLSTSYSGSLVRMSGGILDDDADVAEFEMRGGTVGQFSSSSSTFYGSDFRLDGRAIAGLENAGDQLQFTMPGEALFSGVLEDGTPFAVSRGCRAPSACADPAYPNQAP